MVVYPVRTPPLYWIVAAVLAAMGVFLLGLVAWSWGGLGVAVTGLALLGAAVTFAYVPLTGEYRARGEIRLERGRIEVPDPRGRPLVFDPARVRLHLTHVRTRVTVAGIPAATFRRGTVIDLHDGERRRRISTLALAEPAHGEDLIEDLERVRRGEAPRGPGPVLVDPGPPRPRGEYEAQLDRELAALD